MKFLRVTLAMLAVVLLIGSTITMFSMVWAGAGLAAFSHEWGARLAYAVDADKLAEVAIGKPVPNETVLNAELEGFVGHSLDKAVKFGVGTMGCAALALFVLAAIPWDLRRSGARP